MSCTIASAGHSGTHSAQSIHIAGSIAKKLGPSKNASTGHTATQSVYLQFMQLSVTTNVIETHWLIQFYGPQV